jgi:hypothetical protein
MASSAVAMDGAEIGVAAADLQIKASWLVFRVRNHTLA